MNRVDKYNSDLLVDLLKSHKIDFITANPGSTIRGLYDSIINDKSDENIELILCCHEEISVALAHGYAKISGKPMVVLLHGNIGLLHASMAIFNAWVDRVPMIIINGIGPMAVEKRRPWIDWIHTSQNHANVLQGIVKWQDQPASFPSVVESFKRAYKLTNISPQAPVYLTIDAAVQEEITAESDLNLLPLKLPLNGQADEHSLRLLAKSLSLASNPLIIVDHMGRVPESINYLIEIVEELQIPVIDCGGRYNFPNTHPLCLTGMPSEFYQEIDFVLAIDVADLSAALQKFSKDIEIYRIDLNDSLVSSWVADYCENIDVKCHINSDSSVTLPVLLDYCRQIIPKINLSSLQNRGDVWRQRHYDLREQWIQKSKQLSRGKRLSVLSVFDKFWNVIRFEDWVVVNDASIPMGKQLRKIWKFEHDGCTIGNSGGCGLGYGIGASIGAALALKNTGKIAIGFQGDGDFLFTPSALWTAAHYKVSLLIVIMNNGGYQNTAKHAHEVSQQRSRSMKKIMIGNAITDPNVNYFKLANSFGVAALPAIEKIDEIIPSVRKAIDYIKENKKPFLLEIKVGDKYEN
ncbi:MAG: thiamine pyrophosphate-binding protein [Gammaproteobacteria bacterium]